MWSPEEILQSLCELRQPRPPPEAVSAPAQRAANATTIATNTPAPFAPADEFDGDRIEPVQRALIELRRLNAHAWPDARPQDEAEWDRESEPGRAPSDAELSDADTHEAEEEPEEGEEAGEAATSKRSTPPKRRMAHATHELSRRLAAAVANRELYPLGQHVADGEAAGGHRFVPLSDVESGVRGPPELAADDTPWRELYTSDPKATARVRPLTQTVGAQASAAAALGPDLYAAGIPRAYGERGIVASITGPHAREGDREGGDGAARAPTDGEAKRRRLERGSSKPARYAASIKRAGEPARALTRSELYASPPPPNTKHLVPVDAIDGAHEAMKSLVSALAPAARALTTRFIQELPSRAALQWLSTRVGMARFAKHWEAPFSTAPLDAWSNVAVFFAEPQTACAPAAAVGAEGAVAATAGESTAARPPAAAAPRVQRPLAAHTDRLNALYAIPPWLSWADEAALVEALLQRHSELHAGAETLATDECGSASRAAEYERLRERVGAELEPLGESEAAEGETAYETTAAFNIVTGAGAALTGGFLVLLVGTRDGRPLPKGDAARIKLIIDGEALLSFIPLNAEILFSAGALTHMGTPLYGVGRNARVILYCTAALERSLGHFEAAAAAAIEAGCEEAPLLMSASTKKRLIEETNALADTSKPDALTREQLAVAVDEWGTGSLRADALGMALPGNVEAAFRMSVDALAELGARAGDDECKRHVELKAEARSTLRGECYAPPCFPSLELRYALLSPRVHRAAAELKLAGSSTDASVLLCQFALVASIFTAPFLTKLFEEGLLHNVSVEGRMAAATRIHELACWWEGDDAVAALLEHDPDASATRQAQVRVEARDSRHGPALRYDRFQTPSRSCEVAHLEMALTSVFGLAATAMVEAVEQPTLGHFLAALQRGGRVMYLLGGFGRAKLAVELTWLGLIPHEQTVPGGPGYRSELADVLAAVGVLRPGAKAHQSHLDQLGEALAAAWEARAAAHLEAAIATSSGGDEAAELYDRLLRRFRRALEWLLVRAPLHREVEGLSCEARRWRVGFLAHACVLRSDGRVYKPRCHRRGASRPASAQPTLETWREGEVAVPRLAAAGGGGGPSPFAMARVALADLMVWCGLPARFE